MPYPELMIAPMRRELTSAGVRELRTVEEVDEALRAPGTVVLAVNSMCGCAATRMRPALVRALRHGARPDSAVTVFAGQDLEATARAREYLAPYPPSSPSVALLRDGELLYMMERRQIEAREPESIAADLVRAFDDFC